MAKNMELLGKKWHEIYLKIGKKWEKKQEILE